MHFGLRWLFTILSFSISLHVRLLWVSILSSWILNARESSTTSCALKLKSVHCWCRAITLKIEYMHWCTHSFHFISFTFFGEFIVFRGLFSSNERKRMASNGMIRVKGIFYCSFLSVSQLDPILTSVWMTRKRQTVFYFYRTICTWSDFIQSEFYLIPTANMKNSMTTKPNAWMFQHRMRFREIMVKTCLCKSSFIYWNQLEKNPLNRYGWKKNNRIHSRIWHALKWKKLFIIKA